MTDYLQPDPAKSGDGFTVYEHGPGRIVVRRGRRLVHAFLLIPDVEGDTTLVRAWCCQCERDVGGLWPHGQHDGAAVEAERHWRRRHPLLGWWLRRTEER